jgi:hypothetical protein
MRPSATGQVQQGTGSSNLRHVGWSRLHFLTFLLALEVAVGFLDLRSNANVILRESGFTQCLYWHGASAFCKNVG